MKANGDYLFKQAVIKTLKVLVLKADLSAPIKDDLNTCLNNASIKLMGEQTGKPLVTMSEWESSTRGGTGEGQ